jgi:gamma-glutamyltranspeptidase
MRNLWFNHTIKEAIDAPRLHHQIYPMELGYEFGTLDVNLFTFQVELKFQHFQFIFRTLS